MVPRRLDVAACVAAIPLLLAACGGDLPTASGGGSEPLTGAEDEAGQDAEAEPGSDPVAESGPGEEPAPELRDTRTALQPIHETVPELGDEMASLIARAEAAIQTGNGALADEHIVAMLDAMAGSKAGPLAAAMKADVVAALARDLRTVEKRVGAPKIRVVEVADRCCGKGGRCDEPRPGAACLEVVLGDMVKGCGGSCAQDAAPAPPVQPEGGTGAPSPAATETGPAGTPEPGVAGGAG